ncbi:MAG: SAM-dependent methyltransferase, partial [Patescibacteria group bacterium]
SMAVVLSECRRVLKANGRLLLVLNHPVFRVPKASAWGWDEANHVQYRRIDKYLSVARLKIEMHPGDDPSIHTWSFHRPLQVYMKALHKAGFAVTRLEEWISNRQGPKGKTFVALEQARKEIPLFLFLEARL